MNFNELVQNHAVNLVERLVTDVLTKDAVSVGFEFEDDDQWAIISMHVYEEDKQISLRLHAENRFELYFGYYDDKDEYFEITKILTEDEVATVPKRLQKVMTKVLADEKGMRLPANFLST